jgi:hypothetical protein
MDSIKYPPSQRAIIIGTDERVHIQENIELPQLKTGEFLIRTDAVAVSPSDTKMRGDFVTVGGILGTDYAGTVVALGPHVPSVKIGDRLCGAQNAMNASTPLRGSFGVVKDETRAALLHSAVPYGAILEHLGLSNPSAADPESQAPLFQAIFDYKQGQAESGSIGRANIVESRTSWARTPYNIVLEMSDDPNKDPLIILKLQSERYASGDAEVVMDAYLSILSNFSRNPALRVEDGRLDQGSRAKP